MYNFGLNSSLKFERETNSQKGNRNQSNKVHFGTPLIKIYPGGFWEVLFLIRLWGGAPFPNQKEYLSKYIENIIFLKRLKRPSEKQADQGFPVSIFAGNSFFLTEVYFCFRFHIVLV